MFAGLLNNWHEARGNVLLKEVKDAAERLAGAPPEVGLRCASVLVNALGVVEEQFGPLANISSKGKKDLAAQLNRKGKAAFKMDLGGAYGLFLASAYIEARALPGDHAVLVRSITAGMLQQSRELIGGLEQERSAAQGDQEAQQAIAAARFLGVKSARHAAEMTAGRSMTDAEWAEYGPGWERNWLAGCRLAEEMERQHEAAKAAHPAVTTER